MKFARKTIKKKSLTVFLLVINKVAAVNMNSQISIDVPKEIDVRTITDVPRNYTVFVRALEHVVIGGEKPLHHHAMTQEEYERFVSDMWIGIVLTMVVVFIVFALCFWYMYHKFQQWKRHCKFLSK